MNDDNTDFCDFTVKQHKVIEMKNITATSFFSKGLEVHLEGYRSRRVIMVLQWFYGKSDEDLIDRYSDS